MLRLTPPFPIYFKMKRHHTESCVKKLSRKMRHARTGMKVYRCKKTDFFNLLVFEICTYNVFLQCNQTVCCCGLFDWHIFMYPCILYSYTTQIHCCSSRVLQYRRLYSHTVDCLQLALKVARLCCDVKCVSSRVVLFG